MEGQLVVITIIMAAIMLVCSVLAGLWLTIRWLWKKGKRNENR